MESDWQFPKKLNAELPYEPVIPPKRIKKHVRRKHAHVVQRSMVCNCQKVKTTQIPLTWVDK
jgi:hypothetical protein